MRTELESLAVFGETTLGWDEQTPPNETVDHGGRRFPEDRGFGVPDPRAPASRSHPTRSGSAGTSRPTPAGRQRAPAQ